jgi:VWFA-related protein
VFAVRLLRIQFTVLAAASLLAFPDGTAGAQQPANDKPVLTMKVQAREVLLPVTVRDKHGALVNNLGPGDFTLTEDGRLQTIRSFTRETDLPFRIGLLVDTSHSLTNAMEAERKAAAKFVDLMLPADPKQTKKGDEAFLIHFDREVELLEDFTNAREKLHRELEEMGPSRASRDERQGPETADEDRGQGRRGGERGGMRAGGTQLYDAIFLASDELMKTAQGRKALVVFSDGVDRSSKETLNDAIDAADRASLEIFTIYFKGEEQKGGGGMGGEGPGGNPGGGRRGGWPGSGGSNWPGGGSGGGYPSGGGSGRRGGGGDAVKVDGRKIMEQIAKRTGGRFFETKKKENLEEIYNQIAEELRGQYLLTYTPDKAADGEYHKVVVKAKKDDQTVATREGYYAEETK